MNKLVAHFQKEAKEDKLYHQPRGVAINVKLKALCHVCEAFKTDTDAWVMWLCAI